MSILLDSVEVARRPTVSLADAARLARSRFGAEGPVKELGSVQDGVFTIDTTSGMRIMKVANPRWERSTLEAQNNAMIHFFCVPSRQISLTPKAKSAGLNVPVPLWGRTKSLIEDGQVGGENLHVRLLTYLPGVSIGSCGYLAPQVLYAMGTMSANSAKALASFEHPGLDRVNPWDLRRASAVVRSCLHSVRDPNKRALIQTAEAACAVRLEPIIPCLRLQAIHNDVTDANVVGLKDDAGRVQPEGLVDFGDMCRSWLISELAITLASLIHHRADSWWSLLETIKAFHAIVPLTDEEVQALWPLVLLRACLLNVAGEHLLSSDPTNEAVLAALEPEWLIFTSARAVPFAVAEAAIREALGFGPSSRYETSRRVLAGAGRLLPDCQITGVLDLSVTSDSLHEGRFMEPSIEARLLGQVAGVGATRWGEARLTQTRPHLAQAPATIALGIDLFIRHPLHLVAPFDLTVVEGGVNGLTLSFSGALLILRGFSSPLTKGATFNKGDSLGTVPDAAILHVQLCLEADISPPHFALPGERTAWLELCPDPSILLGRPLAAAAFDVDDLLLRRTQSFAKVQAHYFEHPMRIERGWRHLLVDTDSRCYVDMVNNVAAVGHSHPKIAQAAYRQFHLLNTNSRFHYAAVAELSERLVKIAPPGIDTVFLVNSGSEAVDLALRMAQVATGREDVLAVLEAYHGWTYLADAVTTSLADNPIALETRPPFVHFASAPNSYRGIHKGPDSGQLYADDVRQLVSRLVAEGRPPAAFICEPLYGNAGGVQLPLGYLASAYEAVRAAGGLCIADEVQVGYGRTGSWWAHSVHGVIPDIITVAKAMGNGHPLGAVLCRRQVAELSFAKHGMKFFSSAGGSPVSCVVGLAVLDILEEEKLLQNSATVGNHIIARCEALKERYPILGAVHGVGLYLGVELVRDRQTLEPATAECLAICDRMRELGIIVQPTGERSNILKMKPPMCLTQAAADFFVDQLDHVLGEGW